MTRFWDGRMDRRSDGRTDGRSDCTPRPAFAFGDAGKNLGFFSEFHPHSLQNVKKSYMRKPNKLILRKFNLVIFVNNNIYATCDVLFTFFVFVLNVLLN